MIKTIDKQNFHINHEYFLEPRDLEHITLFQVGERFCCANVGYPEHEQLCFEITYVYDGSAINTINGQETTMKANMLNFTFPSQRHGIHAPADDILRYFYLGFQLKESHPLYQEFVAIQNKQEAVYLNNAFRSYSTFLDAVAHSNMTDSLSELVLVTAINQILLDFIRSYQGEKRTNLSNFTNVEIVLFNMLSHLDENFLTYNNLDNLSKKLGYSASYLSHLFHSSMHCSPSSYVLKKKMEYAKQLLIEEKKSVTEIAEILSYSSIHSFSKAFKKFYGYNPSTVRADHPINDKK